MPKLRSIQWPKIQMIMQAKHFIASNFMDYKIDT